LLLLTTCASAELLRVMTYNVRYPAKGDGPDLWDSRREMFVASVRAKDPDIIGTQELFHLQGQYLVEKAPEYKWFGVSRRGNTEDEHMGVFYKPSKLKLLKSGNFWLSETPETAGSMAWNVTLPRMVTWGLFEMRTSKRKFILYNTHFPHRREDEDARKKCAALIASRIAALDPKVPFILTGDFNAPAEGPVYRVFADAGLSDAWREAPQKFGPEGTFNGFKGTTTGPRIDWIFFRGPGIQPVVAETVTLHRGERYPSDHFPVFTVLEMTTAK
jgi:endonuclease/exonuclease/phosphatase family metal-dependent hydrolase